MNPIYPVPRIMLMDDARTWQELIEYINQVGFLPLFANEVPGFSVEEHVSNLYWWTDNAEQDPWKWREIIAGSSEVVYGKFFNRKAGYGKAGEKNR